MYPILLPSSCIVWLALVNKSSRPVRNNTSRNSSCRVPSISPRNTSQPLEYLRPVGTLFSHHPNSPGARVLEFLQTSRTCPWYLSMLTCSFLYSHVIPLRSITTPLTASNSTNIARPVVQSVDSDQHGKYYDALEASPLITSISVPTVGVSIFRSQDQQGHPEPEL